MTQKYLRIILAVIIVIAAPIAYWYAKSNPGGLSLSGNKTADQILSSEYKVDDVGARSFGQLAQLSLAGGKGGALGTEAAKSASTMPAGSGGGVAVGMGGGMMVGGDAKIVPPYAPEEYRFKYKGEDLGDLDGDQPVFKRVKENFSNGVVDRMVRTLSLGLIDLTSFQSTKLQNFAITEDRSYGYSIFVDVDQGNLNIYQNYNQWPQPFKDCTDEDCYRSRMLHLKDIPEDQIMIDMANAFVAEKHVSLSGYGEPRVYNNWREMYQASPDKANFYFPEVIDVVYPLMIDGQEAYDEGGNPTGLHVSVDIRNNRVAGLYDLTTKQYQKSNYTGVTDTKRIISSAEKGGFRSYSNPGVRGAKVVNLDLDTPTRQMMRMWKYDGNTSEELFVPALVFPIKNPGNYYRKNVIVPLVKDILDNDQNPPVMIMERGSGVAEPFAPADVKISR